MPTDELGLHTFDNGSENISRAKFNDNWEAIDDFAASWGKAVERNAAYYGPATDKGSVTGKRGDTYQESDGTLKLWRHDGSTWNEERGQANHQARTGTWPGGIAPPATSVALPGGLIFKSGAAQENTFSNFGNEYFATQTFATPFPTACIHVGLTPVSVNGGPEAQGALLAIDSLSAASFRAMIDGSVGSNNRAYTWFALGY